MTREVKSFRSRLLPAPVGGGYREDDYWVWCGSVAEGEDGRYHMFAARWPREYPFFQGYLAASEIVRAVADDPVGPYRFEEVVLPVRGSEFWDGRVTHNPYILRRGDEYLLYYIGMTYPGARPSPEAMHSANREPGANGRFCEWYETIRIGVARSKSVSGPWERPDTPTFDINPAGWDCTVVTNPSPCLGPDDRILLYYRSNIPGVGCRLGLATGTDPSGPYTRVGDRPLFDLGTKAAVEDPCVVYVDDHYEMVCKDLEGVITDEFHAGVHMLSDDGIAWVPAPDPKAWSRTVQWDDGTSTTQGSIERPYIFTASDGRSYLFAATANGPGPSNKHPGHYHAEATWNMVIPLES